MSQERLTGLVSSVINHSIGEQIRMMTLLMILHQGRPEMSGFSFSLCFLFLVQ